ncbi:thiamine phosphate synthase [Ferrimonas aestuarii]|uniref:Thiamine-phosphate synthase n=1 Tax=Ferrimonas aestuarii TaxID=2569539 RepID=A0A4V5NYZ6_9GAMM|nr:thiamine phosphate synthase [Ferrimonas aestuarii]TKB57632.1 thiamine phosphate synthase [Ferrimonas aestuarii]
MTLPVVWSLGRFDSTGRHGVQASLRTQTALGCHGCSVLTDSASRSLSAELDALLAELPPQVIELQTLPDAKLGSELKRWLADNQDALASVRFVVNLDGIDGKIEAIALVCQSLARAGAELAVLTSVKSLLQRSEVSPESSFEANQVAELAAGLRQRLGVSTLVVSNADEGKLCAHGVDLVLKQEHYLLENRLPKAAAGHPLADVGELTAGLSAIWAQGYDFDDALVVARAYVNGLNQGSAFEGDEYGAHRSPAAAWPAQFEQFPKVALTGSRMESEFGFAPSSLANLAPFPRCDTYELGLYPVVDSLKWLERLLAQGVKTLQLRAKDLTQEQAEPMVAEAIAMGRRCGARLFINDYWQLAIKYGAYGVHLGQEDMAVADLNAIAEAGICLGISTHGYFEIMRAASLNPSYIALGHIFPTTTKEMPSAPQGLARLSQYHGLLAGRWPTVAIGGINAERAPKVAATGVGSIAVVRAVTEAADLRRALEALWLAYESGQDAREASYAR